MTEYNAGDLVEAVKGDTVIRARLEASGLRPGAIGRTSVPGIGRSPEELEQFGFTVETIERATPPLPTEPGFYLNRRKELWTLENNGSWRNDYDDPESPAAVFNSAPLTRLEPVADTAKKVLDALSEYLDGQLTGRTKNDIIGHLREEFGGTS